MLVLAALRRSGTPLLLKEHPGLAYATVFLGVWALASTLWASDANRAASDGFRLVLNVTLVFIVFAAVRRGRDARWLVWGYLAGAVVAALVGLVVPGFEVEGRVAGTLGPNLLAAMLVPALVFSLFALGWTRSAAGRWLLVGCIALFTVTIFLTQSRGGLVALAAALAAALVFAGPVRRHFVALTVVAASVGAIYYTAFASPESLARVTNPGGGTGRSDLWSIASGVIADHPVQGVGAGNFPVVSREYATETINLQYVRLVVDTPEETHNAYLGLFTELGLVGLVTFGVVVLATLTLALRATRAFARAREPELELLSRALFVGLVGLLAALRVPLGAAREAVLAPPRVSRSLCTRSPAGGSRRSRRERPVSAVLPRLMPAGRSLHVALVVEARVVPAWIAALAARLAASPDHRARYLHRDRAERGQPRGRSWSSCTNGSTRGFSAGGPTHSTQSRSKQRRLPPASGDGTSCWT